jgi:hypothetical protein
MLDRITAQAVAEAQQNSEAFTLTNAAEIIVAKANMARSHGAHVDVMVLAASVVEILNLPAGQSVGVVKEALRISDS